MVIQKDGYQTTISFSSAEMDSMANLLTLMEEKEVTQAPEKRYWAAKGKQRARISSSKLKKRMEKKKKKKK